MSFWGCAIPGLAMRASELPEVANLLRLENPEIGNNRRISKTHSIREIATFHLETLERELEPDMPCTFIGISLGSMILAVLASEFRSRLPKQSTFRFLSPSVNAPVSPAVPESTLLAWSSAKPGDVNSYRLLLEPFFSAKFRAENAAHFETYVRYRAFGENQQSEKAFRKQTAALRHFDGNAFAQLNPHECKFYFGAEDLIFGESHRIALREILPRAEIHEIEGAGHMLHVEAAWLFEEQVTL